MATLQNAVLRPTTIKTFFLMSLVISVAVLYVFNGGVKITLTESIRSSVLPEVPVAIIVPYRDRKVQLKIFLNYMHSYLENQKTNAHIYVVEQTTGKFNRAKLFNVGYNESQKDADYNCYIFHDVDLIPEELHNSYTCEDRPIHMSVAVDKFNYTLTYEDLFGGVVSLTKEHMKRVNGFSNAYWGWGGEDDDMQRRLIAKGIKPSRRSMNVSRYTMLRNKHQHTKAAPNLNRHSLLDQAVRRQNSDGLSSLQYTVVKKVHYPSHTWILANLRRGHKH